MNKVYVLTLALFKNSLRNTGQKNGRLSNFAGIIITAVVFGLLFGLMALTTGYLFHQAGLTAEFLAMVFLAAQLIVFIFGTILLVNVMFFSKDAEFLLSLPVTSTTVFIAKFLYVYFSELMLAGFLVLTAGVVYGIVCGFAATYYLLLIVAVFLMPLVPLVISALISVPLMYVISFFKNKGILTLLILMALFGGLMYLYFDFFLGLGQNGEEINLPFDEIKAMMGALLPNIAMARIATLTSSDYLTDILIVLLFSVGMLAASTFVSLFTYKRGVRAQLEQAQQATSGKIEYLQSSVLKTLIIKDVKEIFGNTGLAFYCLFQLVFAPIIAIFYSSFGKSMDGGMGPEWMGFSITALMMFMMVFAMNYSALTSFSREGKNFYILKTLPLPMDVHLKAKKIIADTIMVAGIIIACVTMFIVLPGLALDIILFFIFALIFGLGHDRLLILLDVKNPKLDWDNIVMALKNSKESFISMGICMGAGFLFFFGYILVKSLPFNPTLMAVLFWAFFFAVAIGLNLLFNKLLRDSFQRCIMRVE